MYKPYCYLIGWSNLNVWYYGSEYGQRTKIANPKNLWTTYFTSSDIVKEFRTKHGEPDIIEVRKEFINQNDAIIWEYKVLQRLKVKHKSNWLNKNDGKSPIGLPWTNEQKIKKSNLMKGSGNHNFGKTTSLKTKQKISETLTKKPSMGMLGKSHSDETKQKMSKNHKDFNGNNNPNFGNKWSADLKKSASKSRNPKIWVFIHQIHGIVESTIFDMISKYPNLNRSSLKALCSGKLKTYKEWKLHTP